LQVLYGIFLLLLRRRSLRASSRHFHDRSPMGSRLPMRRASPSRAERPQGSLAAMGKSELRHTGSSPPEKGDFGRGGVDCIDNRPMRATQPTIHNRPTTVARAPVALPISDRSLVSSMRPTSLAPV
jgi:hypothetical protein